MPGMLIFFDWATQDGVPDHVGIVERVENNVVYTVEGNSKDMCRQKQYSLGSRVILGYGMPASVWKPEGENLIWELGFRYIKWHLYVKNNMALMNAQREPILLAEQYCGGQLHNIIRLADC